MVRSVEALDVAGDIGGVALLAPAPGAARAQQQGGDGERRCGELDGGAGEHAPPIASVAVNAK